MDKPLKCCLCETELDKISIGLNKKINGRKVTKLFCLNCLAENLDVSVEDLLDKVESFKAQGCTLFI